MDGQPFWFQRCTAHWCPPRRLDLAEHVRQARLQVVQAGLFGPMYYALADDETVDRWFVGQPLVGIEANLEYARDLIARVQAAGARFVGTMSMSWHYGDHEAGKGLWQAWDRLWTEPLLGPQRPCTDPAEAMQVDAAGGVRCWPIGGRPYRTYSGCLCNPLWLATLKPMVRKAVVDLGLDGLCVHHGFEGLCRCGHCRSWLWPRLSEAFTRDELAAAFGAADLEAVPDLLEPRQDSPPELRSRVASVLESAAQHCRKEAFDELFVTYGRSLKPDLLLAQWYHKYNFKPRDERSRLPDSLWARDESYLWYSQGSQKGRTYFQHGWLADMGMPARFLHAAAGGRPFVINKYDWDRWRLSIGEAAAHGGAALAVHWAPHGEDDRPDGAEDRYRKRVYPYQRFLADHEDLYRGARPYSELALVYPRRGEVAGEAACSDALRRIGALLENDHYLFDLILDEQLTDRGADYGTLVLADVKRLAPAQVAFLRWWVTERDGRVVLAGQNGTQREDGRPRGQPPFADWGRGAGGSRVLSIPEGPWAPDRVQVKEGPELSVYPLPDRDAFGQRLLGDIGRLVESRWLVTDAPWYVRTRAWRTAGGERIALHWVNYRQVENLADEVPIPVAPFRVALRLSAGAAAHRVEWLDPEQGGEPRALAAECDGAQVRFATPGVTVYGVAVIHLEPEAP